MTARRDRDDDPWVAYAERLDELSEELRFRLRAVGLRPTNRDWLMDRYVPERGLVHVMWRLLDDAAPSRRDVDVLLRAVDVMERHVAPLPRINAR